ncbi:aldehyde oxygenase (deformylating), partial [Sarracenia purpurea var. burkii]
MWPLTCWSMLMTWIHGRTFLLERNYIGRLKLHSWVIPRYTVQYLIKWQRQTISGLIEEAILDAEARGIKVLSLGLLNQGEELNNNAELYIQRYPQLNVKLVDGSSLAVAIVLNSIPKDATQVLFRGNLSKVAYSIISSLCQRGIQ